MKYTVIQPIDHNGARTESGLIELDEAAAAPLLALGHIALPEKKGAKAAVEADA